MFALQHIALAQSRLGSLVKYPALSIFMIKFACFHRLEYSQTHGSVRIVVVEEPKLQDVLAGPALRQTRQVNDIFYDEIFSTLCPHLYRILPSLREALP